MAQLTAGVTEIHIKVCSTCSVNNFVKNEAILEVAVHLFRPHKYLSNAYFKLSVRLKLTMKQANHLEGGGEDGLPRSFHPFNLLDLLYRHHKYIDRHYHHTISKI